MPQRLVARLVTTLLLALAVGCTGNTEDAAAETGAADPGAADPGAADPGAVESSDEGAAHYAAYCVACHGSDGQGGSGPPHTEVVPGLGAAELEQIIVEGTGGMPPIYVPEDELAPLVAHVMETFG
jgi:mono/diheme cytochrome c family protein